MTRLTPARMMAEAQECLHWAAKLHCQNRLTESRRAYTDARKLLKSNFPAGYALTDLQAQRRTEMLDQITVAIAQIADAQLRQQRHPGRKQGRPTQTRQRRRV